MHWFIAFKFKLASSSDYPPDKKTIPGTAGTTVLEKAKAVLKPISWGLAFTGCVDPYVTIFGLSIIPSKKTLLSDNALKTAALTFSVTLWQTSIEWGPSERISGSTIGARPFSWHIAAYLAKPHAFSWIAYSVGQPSFSSIFNTALHLANLQPIS